MLRLYAPFTGVSCLVVITSVFLSVSGLWSPVRGQTAYFSLEGDVIAVGDQHEFLLELTRSVGSSENLAFITYTHSGGTNYAGDMIPAGGFDSDLHLYDGLSVLHGQDDESGPGLDALLTWIGSDTPLNPDPLSSGSYRLNHQEYLNNSTGALAVDLAGPADALIFTGVSASGSGTIDSLKFGTTGSGTAVYSHGGTVNLLGELVVAPTGNAELNLTAGSLTVAGLATINSGGTIDLSGGNLYANGGVLVDGGTISRTSGFMYLNAGTTMTASNSGTIAMDSSYNINGMRTFDINSGSSMSVTGYLDVGSGTDGVLIVDGLGSTLTTGSISNFWGFNGATAQVTIRDQATITIGGPDLRIAHGSTANTTGLVSIESGATMLVNSHIYIAIDGPTGGTGSITVTDANSNLEQTGAHTLTVGHATDGTGMITIDNTATFTTGTGDILINPTGMIEVTGGGVFNANGSVLIDGGTIDATGNGFNLAAGKTLTAMNNGQVNFSGNHNIANNSTYTFTTGADLNSISYIDVGNGSDGTLIVDGPGSSISTESISYYGSNGGTGNVTLRNQAIAYFNNPLRIVQGSSPGTTGVFNVESEAHVNLYGEMTIANGGPSGGSGEVTITGGFSTIVQNGDVGLTVGHASNGTGLLTITDNGSFSSGTGDIRINATGTIEYSAGGKLYANGDVIIDGGTLHRDTGGLFFHASGKALHAYNNGLFDLTGAYTINGGSVYTFESGSDWNCTSYIDIGSGSNGELIIDGPGSTLTIYGQSYWGSNGGTGLVTLRNEAYAELVKLQLAEGSTAGTSGNFSVESDADALVQGDISLAVSGPTGGSASLLVSGPGSTLTQIINYNLDVGHTTAGSASVTINNGASYIQDTGSVYIHNTGTVNVSNGGSLDTGGTTDIRGGSLTLDDGEIITGSFELTSGAFNFNDGLLAIEGGTFDPGVSTYSIDGPGPMQNPTLKLNNGASAPSLTGALHVGQANRGSLEILNGSTLTSTEAILAFDPAGKGYVWIDGAGSSWDITSTDLKVGRFGYGQLDLTDHAELNVADDLVIAQLAGSMGTMLVADRGLVEVQNRIFVSEFGDAELTISYGGTVISHGHVWTTESTSGKATINVTDPGTHFDAMTSLNIGGSPSAGYGPAVLNISNGADVLVGSDLRIWDQGAINFSGGTLTANTIHDISGGMFKFTGGVLHVNTYDGHLINNGGRVAPGNSVSLTLVQQDYTQLAGSLEIELADSPGLGGIDYDQLDVIGSIELAGILDIQLYDGFMPAIGDRFDVITYDYNRYGVFDQVLLPKMPGLGLDLVYMSKSVRLVTRLAGDLNGDGFVGLDDLDIVLGAWNDNVKAGTWVDGDPSGDGFVGLDDLDIILNNWNAGTPPGDQASTTIPEPAAGLMLFGMVITGSMLRNGRSRQRFHPTSVL